MRSQPGQCGFSKEEMLRTRLLLKDWRRDPVDPTGGWRRSFNVSIADDRAGTRVSVDESLGSDSLTRIREGFGGSVLAC